jgi:CheY-like chemotaxis protein
MAQRNPLVFVVDDESVIASTLAAILKESGFKPVFFTNPLAALQSAKVIGPDLLISDVIMPQMTGVELAIQIRKVAPLCKVLLLSGEMATAELIERAQEDGHHFAVLAKPVHPTDLLSAIRTL